MAKDTWTPEETRYFFQLYAEERRKGNKSATGMNKVGKKNIMDAFELRFKKGFSDWKKDFKNKYDTSRKKYIKIKALTQNRTGLGYDSMGRILMSDDWWNEREKMIKRWILEDEDGDYDDELGLFDVATERVSHRTDRGAGWRYVQQLMYESDQQCYDILRMHQRTFKALCKLLTEQYGLKESHNVYLEESVAMFLEVVGQDKTKRVIASRYQRSLDTVQRKLDDVLCAILKFAADTLRPQEGEFERVSPVVRNDRQYWPHFKDCVGALDGTHVPVRPPSQNAEAYNGRKGVTMNVLAICNFDMKFIYAYVGVPGRAHDSKVLTHCARNEASFPHPPPGKYYLVDSGYSTRTGYLGPHRNMRYHIPQFQRGGPPVSARELFNKRHSSLRSYIERTFGVWKAKWRILDRKHPKYGLVKWIKLVTATMALHNFIRDSHRDDQDFLEWENVDVGVEEAHDGDEEEEEEEEGDDDDGGGHIEYEPRGDTAMEVLRDNITNGFGRGRLPY